MNKIRFATVGTSAICEQFIESAAGVEELCHAAVFSRQPETGEKFAARMGCENVFCDMEMLAASNEIDAVYIASPNAFHSSQSRLFLENGKHIICEKPITTSLEDYLKNKKIADERGLIYLDAMKSCNTPWRGEVKKALSEIGNISLARIDFSQRSGRYDGFMAGVPQNIFEPRLHSGTLMDLGVYCVYAACDLLGKPDSAVAAAALFKNGSDKSGAAILKYPDYIASLTYSKASNTSIYSEIIGDKGSLRINSISQYIGVQLVVGGEIREIVPLHDKITVMRGEAQNFADFILGRRLDEYRELSTLCETAMAVMDSLKSSSEIVYG